MESRLTFDRNILVKNIFRFKKMTKTILSGKEINIFYAVKANNCSEVLDVVFACGVGAEILSNLELQSIPEYVPIQVNGHQKSRELLIESCKRECCTINIESISELKQIAKIEKQKIINIAVRIKISENARIGMPEQEIYELVKCIKNFPNINLVGLHFHAGWNLNCDEEYEAIIKRMLSIHEQIVKNGIQITSWNMGGSFTEPSSAPGQLRERLLIIKKYLPKEVTNVCFEPGRYFVGDAGKLYAEVKEKRGNEVIINCSTYGHRLSGATPSIGFISSISGTERNMELSEKNKGMRISGIWPSENDCVEVIADGYCISEGDTVVFNNMGAYLEGTYSTLWHEAIKGYDFVGELHELVGNLENEEKYVICKYYQQGELILPQNKSERQVILGALKSIFSAERWYTEQEVNTILAKYNQDFCLLRREMVINALLERVMDGKMKYHRK